MVAVASCFAQILALIDRTAFARAVRQHAAERAAKGFSCWDHFVLWWLGHRAGQVGPLGCAPDADPLNAGLCQCPSPLATGRDPLLSGARPLPGRRSLETAPVPIQASVANPGYDDH